MIYALLLSVLNSGAFSINSCRVTRQSGLVAVNQKVCLPPQRTYRVIHSPHRCAHKSRLNVLKDNCRDKHLSSVSLIGFKLLNVCAVPKKTKAGRGYIFYGNRYKKGILL